MRIPYDEVVAVLSQVLTDVGFREDRARTAAELFADASRDGVASHGLNRFPGFLRMVQNGYVKPAAVPALVKAAGAVERWDGNSGPGMLNAAFCMTRAIEIAAEHTVGVVGLRNTNHWMRGANYGWLAAEAGCIGVCWTNTLPNLIPWGGTEPTVGNNPLVVAVPRPGGHVVLDMAMSQFSYGRLGTHVRTGEPLPVVGGEDSRGNPTTDAGAITDGGRLWPAGYWKGSGLALLLDLIAALVSGGKTTAEIGELATEHAVSQFFLALDPRRLDESGAGDAIAETAVAFAMRAADASDADAVRYPGQGTLARRCDSEEHGVIVDDNVWGGVTAALPGGGTCQTQRE